LLGISTKRATTLAAHQRPVTEEENTSVSTSFDLNTDPLLADGEAHPATNTSRMTNMLILIITPGVSLKE